MKLILIIVTALVLITIVCSLILNRIMFQTVKTVNQQHCHEQYAERNSPITFRSGKNLLNGCIYGAGNKAGIVVISPGMGVTSDYYIPEALWLTEHGYMVMTFDNTAYRNNPGSFRGFSQAVLDLRAAVHYAEQYELPITLFGHSMGGYAVCAVLNFADVTVDKVVSVAGFATINQVIHSYAKANIKKLSSLIELLVRIAQFIYFGWRKNLSAVDGINGSETKIVIAQGKNDEEVLCDTVSIYGHQALLRKTNIRYLLFDQGIHSTHMGIVRGDSNEMLNEDLLRALT